MATIHLPPDFKEFFQLLNANQVEYLLVGGYAVGYYGYPRATVDLDIWVAISPANANRLLVALEQFGFGTQAGASVKLLTQAGNVIRLGQSPLRIEIQTTISGVSFEDCYARRIATHLDGTPVTIISVEDLKINKLAAARLKDLNDLENLP